jgi:predicted kinase
LTDPDYDDYSGLRGYTKSLTKQRMKLYQQGKLGMIIDGTGHNFGKIQAMKKMLEDDGYDTYMVMVNTSLEVAQKRNKERDRVLPEDLLAKSWKDVQKNIGAFQNLFKRNFVIVDNSKHLDDKEAEAKFVPLVTKVIRKFVAQPIKNKLGKKWVAKQKLLKRRK